MTKWYRKKPIPVTATQWFKHGDHPEVTGYDENWLIAGEDETPVNFGIHTLEGHIKVTPGCWIVGPGYSGEYWPVQDDIFRATYEPCTDIQERNEK
jgi:hypothetical protein